MDMRILQVNLGSAMIQTDNDWIAHEIVGINFDIPLSQIPDEDEVLAAGFHDHKKYRTRDNEWIDAGLSEIPFWYAPEQVFYPRSF
uniref:Anaphase-promoting complex subunit 13 n=1 Tax=Rhabditophanes sp. KR3021 TaxID=114890 RepID=A0AC35UDT1_9BILA